MSVNPLDLQVLFSKASDYAASLGKQSSVHDAEDYQANKLQTKNSRNAPEVVNKSDAYDESFTQVSKDSKNPQGNQKRQFNKKEQESNKHKKAMKEEGTGLIIDILD